MSKKHGFIGHTTIEIGPKIARKKKLPCFFLQSGEGVR